MKTYNSLFRLTAILLLMGTFSIWSCQKESSTTDPVQQENLAFTEATGNADSEAETVFDDVFDNVMGVDAEVGIGGIGVFTAAPTQDGQVTTMGTDTLGRCFQVSYTFLNAPNRFPVKVITNFGTGCLGRDGRYRKGAIITEYSGPMIVPGNSTTTRFEAYTIDSVRIAGTYKITNVSTSNQRAFRNVVTAGLLIRANGDTTKWTSEKTLTQLEGNGTPLYPLDDILQLTGASSGYVKKSGKVYEWKTLIKEPLVKKFTCHWLVKGIVTMKRNDQPLSELNYGKGDCDNKATLTVNSQSKEITLR